MADEAYEGGGGNQELFIAGDGTLHAGGSAVGTVKVPAIVDASALPAADPHVAGRLWSNAGVITRSAG